MAKLRANGTEVARYQKKLALADEERVMLMMQSVRKKEFRTRGPEIRILRKSRFEDSNEWSNWKLVGKVGSIEAARDWHRARDWVEVAT